MFTGHKKMKNPLDKSQSADIIDIKAEYQKDCEGNKTQFRRLRESAVAAKPTSRAVCITHPGVFRPIA